MDYRERIKNALRELAAERGFSRVTMDELAARTGISKRTVYRYFRSKEEIIESFLSDFLSDVEQKLQREINSSGNPVEKIWNAIKAIPENIRFIQPTALYDLQKYYPHLWEKIERFRAEKILQFYVNLLIKDENGFFRKINPKIFTAALLASVRSVINPNFLIENNLSPEETITSLFTIFMYGIVSEKERSNGENK